MIGGDLVSVQGSSCQASLIKYLYFPFFMYFIANMSHMTEGGFLQNLGEDARSIQVEDNASYLHHSNFVKISAPLLNYSIRAYP